MRKKVSVLLLLMLCLSTMAMAYENRFEDVPQDAWFADAVATCVSNQMISGTSPTTFSPDQAMTRAQFVTILGRMDGASAPSTDSPFSDVPQSAYYARYVLWANNANIVKGTDTHLFSPFAPITRQQMAAIVAGYLSYKKVTLPAVETPAMFQDTDQVAAYAKQGVETLRLAGLLCGDNGNVQPNKKLTRAEGATVLARLREQMISAGTVFPELTPEAPSVSPLHVSGTHLVNDAGEIVQLRGVSTHGIAWYSQYVNAACFRQLHDEWNVNVVRLVMYTEEYGGYCAGGDQTALKNLLYDGTQYAADAGLYAIIDWHILSDGNPNTHLAEAKAFFEEMSSRCAAMDNVLYEICNEPNGGTTWAQIKQYAAQIIPIIRANDPNAVILVGTPNWSQRVDQAAQDPITGDQNLMYTLHFYADTHRDDLRATLTEAVQNGLPIFVSEFGACDASGQGALNLAQAEQWMHLLDQNQISYVAWNLSNKPESCALLQPTCMKASQFGSVDLSEAGQWYLNRLNGSLSGDGAPPDAAKLPQTDENAADNQMALLPCIARITNSWATDDRYYYQLELTIQNDSDRDCTGWRAALPLPPSCTLSQGWNAAFTMDGDTLCMTSLSYNAKLAAGADTTAGCIVSCASALTLPQHGSDIG